MERRQFTRHRALHVFVLILVIVILTRAQSGHHKEEEKEVEYPPYDGWYNNYAHPDWGASDTALLRLLPHAYSDGVYMPSGMDRPNPIAISQIVFNGTTGYGSYRNRSALLVFFGQQMVEEILDAQLAGCPPEYFNIDIPKGHPEFDPNSEGGRIIPFLRTRYDQRTGFSPNVPREQLNEISAYFDGSLMYGPHKAWADALRLFKWGLLRATNDTPKVDCDPDCNRYFPAINNIRLPYANPPPPRDHKLKPLNRFYRIGNPRGNENPFLLTFGILWFRYHNLIARRLNATHKGTWSDEKLFNEARKWTIATHQKIVYYDWFPAWLGEDLPPYEGYDPNVHPQIAHVFQSAAMRFGHTLVPPAVWRRNKDCVFRNTTNATDYDREGRSTGSFRALRTCNSFWNGQDAVRETDIDEILLGMSSQVAEREDNIVTPDLRGNVFGGLDFNRRDLMAVNIQRARDHGLPGYNAARVRFGLHPLKNFSDYAEVNPVLYDDNRDLFTKLEKLYEGDINKLDIWPGGMLETNATGPGPLFRRIIFDQFKRIRTADRFWFENYKMNKLFTEPEIAQIRNTTIKDVIVGVTKIRSEDIQKNPFSVDRSPCPQPHQLNHNVPTDMEECTPLETYDYFSGSELSYSLTLLGLFGTFIPILGTLLYIAHQHNAEETKEMSVVRMQSKKKMRSSAGTSATDTLSATEWIGKQEGTRNVTLVLDSTSEKKCIKVKDDQKLLRTIDVPLMQQTNGSVSVILSADIQMKMMVIQVPKEYDLVLIFDDPRERQDFLTQFKAFLTACGGVKVGSHVTMSEKTIKNTVTTKSHRQKILEDFFAAVFAHSYQKSGINKRATMFSLQVDTNIVNTELTKYEFADALSLRADSIFVENMFKLVDKNNSGLVSFREFLDFFVIFSDGNAEEKAKLLFDMYDLQGTGSLSKTDFKKMLKSLVELANEKIEDNRIDALITDLFNKAHLDNLQKITLADFQKFLSSYKNELGASGLELKFGDQKGAAAAATNAKRENAPARARKTMIRGYSRDHGDDVAQRRQTALDSIKPIEHTEPTSEASRRWLQFVRFIENYRRQIVWLTLYSLVLLGIFIERAYYYSVEREHAGLRRIAGYGVTITRGAASAMMFTYSSLLVTMCRNVITFLRETFLNRFIPFDEAVTMHKIIAMQALFFTVMHIIGHCINFYHIATQPPMDLSCLFRNYFYQTHYLPKFHYWCWQTVTGVTGVLMTIQMFIMYVFATQYARRHAYKAFWITHSTYPIFFFLMIMHGAGRLVQAPFFYYFFLGPVILFAIDYLISVSRKKIEINVFRAELLPSDVTYLEFRKPSNFEYRSGQWVRIACLGQSSFEYHPFTLTSSPHEGHLSVHVRAVGPWTRNLRKLYDPQLVMNNHLPKIYLDGPYGEGHQDWNKFEVSILIGGGIGVTPFASILKHIAYSSQIGQQTTTCKKVYFIWVTRTQRQFEWLTDIIRDVEHKDKRGIVSVHVFITQFREKFDFRTTMLFICERHFQKISEQSLFTGLKSITHFGRPDFVQLFQLLTQEHPETDVFGVFSCGPPPMTLNVEQACSGDNNFGRDALFVHHYENF